LSTATTSAPVQGLSYLKGRWIAGWNPEDTAQWESGGAAIARRNLGYSIYAEFLGFVVWQLWSIVVVSLHKYGFDFTDGQQFWLISMPSLVGATLRFPYTFMVAKIGGRNWTIISAGLLLIPTVAMSFAIANRPDASGVGGTSYGIMVLVAALGGFGGGNFASSMANITFFYPQRMKGWALGLNAAGGNIGAAVAQFAVPVLVSITAAASVPNLPIAGWFWIPFILLAMAGAIWGMHNLTSAKTDFGAYAAALRDPQLWLMSLLYIGTFGSFIGMSGAFPKLIADQFPAYAQLGVGPAMLSLAFLGPLVGSLARPYGGRLADRLGGAYVTVTAFLVMGCATLAAIAALHAARPNFWGFLSCFLVLFVATGAGNGSMYRMIPTVFAFRAGQRDARNVSAGIATDRKTAAALGIISAFGAYGGFIVPQLFGRSKTHFGNYTTGLWWFVIAYVVFLGVTIAAYVIPYARQRTRV
jgi:NNP family nitrate/nitrite transporter-like MFS transporter